MSVSRWGLKTDVTLENLFNEYRRCKAICRISQVKGQRKLCISFLGNALYFCNSPETVIFGCLFAIISLFSLAVPTGIVHAEPVDDPAYNTEFDTDTEEITEVQEVEEEEKKEEKTKEVLQLEHTLTVEEDDLAKLETERTDIESRISDYKQRPSSLLLPH